MTPARAHLDLVFRKYTLVQVFAQGRVESSCFVMYLWQTSALKAHLHSIYSGYTDMSGDSGRLSSYYNLGRYDLSVEEGGSVGSAVDVSGGL